MKLVIVIENDNMDDLFAVGVKDLMSHFIPKWFKVDSKDIKTCTFEELRDSSGEGIITVEDALNGKNEYHVITHKDNYNGE